MCVTCYTNANRKGTFIVTNVTYTIITLLYIVHDICITNPYVKCVCLVFMILHIRIIWLPMERLIYPTWYVVTCSHITCGFTLYTYVWTCTFPVIHNYSNLQKHNTTYVTALYIHVHVHINVACVYYYNSCC